MTTMTHRELSISSAHIRTATIRSARRCKMSHIQPIQIQYYYNINPFYSYGQPISCSLEPPITQQTTGQLLSCKHFALSQASRQRSDAGHSLTLKPYRRPILTAKRSYTLPLPLLCLLLHIGHNRTLNTCLSPYYQFPPSDLTLIRRGTRS